MNEIIFEGYVHIPFEGAEFSYRFRAATPNPRQARSNLVFSQSDQSYDGRFLQRSWNVKNTRPSNEYELAKPRGWVFYEPVLDKIKETIARLIEEKVEDTTRYVGVTGFIGDQFELIRVNCELNWEPGGGLGEQEEFAATAPELDLLKPTARK